MKTNNDQLDEQNLTPEEESIIILSSGCFVMFLLIVLLIILSIIALLTRGLYRGLKNFCIKTTSEERSKN